jgi:hypothetical protein
MPAQTTDPDGFPSPKEFLRARRPERFSDSESVTITAIDRNLLEYHLNTLTSRNQESDFANFAHKLAERTICPNLRPQTGPAGGGDSKADAETYPVAEDLALAWFVGESREAASERWAFAFSTKKAWQGKVRSDVAKIANTKRGYVQAFFVTSQYVRDRDRADLEDELKKKHKFERVTILDRGWILNEVFKNGLQSLAIEELRISTPPKAEVQTGPRDTQRRKEMARLDQEITTLLGDRSADTRLVWDGIKAAELARELELPRSEIDGRYVRAIDLADKYGTERQKVEARYQWAWTTFWWHEDFAKFAELYLEFEGLAKDSSDIGELRKLHNLWNLFSRVQASGKIPEAKLRWNDRIVTLSNALDRMTKAEEMPSAALEAKLMLLWLQAFVTHPNVPANLFVQFKEVIESGEGLIGFPLKSTCELIAEMGDLFPDNQDFDDLSETITTVLARHDGEVSAADNLMRRSIQKLDAGHDYDAIELSGRALERLFKNDTQEEFIDGLYVAAAAYERIGLLWAARGSLINAASLMVSNYHRNHDPEALRISCFQRLKWIELFLGRLPDSLAWYEIEQGTRSVQGKQPKPRDNEDFVIYGGVLGHYFVRTDLATLKTFERLPDVLDSKGLYHTKIALLFALGWEEKAKAELGEALSNDLAEDMLKLRDQPAVDDLPTLMQLGDQPVIHMSSNLIGCQIHVEAQDTPACRLVGESFLAALESGMATAMREHFIPMVRGIDVSITSDTEAPCPFSFEVKDSGTKLKCAIKCADIFDPNKIRQEDQSKVKEKMFELIVHVVAKAFPIPDFFEKFEKLFVKAGGCNRAISFTGSIVTLGNVLGHTPPLNIQDWMKEAKNIYELKRTKPWDTDCGVPRREAKSQAKEEENKSADIRHQDVASLTVINVRLWDEAGWRGTMYFGFKNMNAPPVLVLGFDNLESGIEIFKDWREQFGEEDKNNEIRVVIVKGVYKDYPSAYRIAICGNFEGPRGQGKSYFSNIARLQTMQSTDGKSLRDFLEDFGRIKAYWLSFTKMGDMAPPKHHDLSIAKRHLVVREAWTIGLHDIDCMAICTDDDPVIPADVDKPPVVELLAKRRAQTQV